MHFRAPPVFIRHVSGPGSSDADNNRRLLEALQDIPPEKRSARFQCVMVYLHHAEDPTPIICQGTWEGQILEAPRGEGGFGYDPLFLLTEKGCTSAELPPEEKNRLSHRGQALRRLLAALSES